MENCFVSLRTPLFPRKSAAAVLGNCRLEWAPPSEPLTYLNSTDITMSTLSFVPL